MSKITRSVFGSLILLGATACGSSMEAAEPEMAMANEATAGAEDMVSPDIVDTAVAAGNFSTLVAAVQAAGLVDTLKGDGPFTVFAPTDAAFDALPDGTVEDLLKEENRDKLKAILTYHVVSGDVRAEQVVQLDSATTVQGNTVAINSSDEGVRVGDANVVQTDIACSNGVIHVIDKVLIPEG